MSDQVNVQRKAEDPKAGMTVVELYAFAQTALAYDIEDHHHQRTPMNQKLALSVAAFVAAIVAANLMTTYLGMLPIGFGFIVTAGTFAAGFALLARDLVHKHGGIQWALPSVLIGASISWYLASPQLALASTVAFLSAELVDMAIYAPTRKHHGFIRAAILSNIVSAPIDTALFLHIAGFPVTFEAIAGQFIAKVVWATLLPLAIYALGRHALLRQPVHAEGP